MYYVPFTCSAGTTEIISAVTDNYIDIHGIFFQCSILGTVTLKSDTNNLTGAMSFAGGGGLNLPANLSNALFRCNLSEAFVITLTGLGATCSGAIMYQTSA